MTRQYIIVSKNLGFLSLGGLLLSKQLHNSFRSEKSYFRISLKNIINITSLMDLGAFGMLLATNSIFYTKN